MQGSGCGWAVQSPTCSTGWKRLRLKIPRARRCLAAKSARRCSQGLWALTKSSTSVPGLTGQSNLRRWTTCTPRIPPPHTQTHTHTIPSHTHTTPFLYADFFSPFPVLIRRGPFFNGGGGFPFSPLLLLFLFSPHLLPGVGLLYSHADDCAILAAMYVVVAPVCHYGGCILGISCWSL